MSSILITGGSGFIGSHFHRFVPLEKLINLDLVKPSFQSQFVQGDIRNENEILNALEGKGVKTVISLAAKHHDFGIEPDEYFDTNEKGTQTLCNAATKAGINEIVFFSSVAVYGSQNEVSSECLEPNPVTPYGQSKLAGENVLRRWASENKQRKVIIIRPALVFGENNTANMYNLIKQIDSGLYFHIGSAANVKSIAYVENIVQATLFLLEHVESGVSVYNYADEPHLSTRKIGDVIANDLGKKIRLTIPKSLGITLALPFDFFIKVTGKNLPISTARIKKLAADTQHSASKIFSEGFVPPFSTVDGLKKMVKWYRSAVSN